MTDTAAVAWRFAIMLALAGLAGLLAGVRPTLVVHQSSAGGIARVESPGQAAQAAAAVSVAAGERRVVLRLPALLPSRLAYHPSDRAEPATLHRVQARVLGLPLGAALPFVPPVSAQNLAARDFEQGPPQAGAEADRAVLVDVPWPLRVWWLLPATLFGLAGLLALRAWRSLPRPRDEDGHTAYQARFPLLFLAVCYGVMVDQAIGLGPWLPLWDDWRYVYPGRFSLIEGPPQWLGAAGNDTYFLTGQLVDWLALRVSGGSFLPIRLVALALLGVFLVFAARFALMLPRRQALLALLALAFVLGADGYWTLQAIAYHQFLPVLFLMIALLVMQGQWQRPEPPSATALVAVAACALLAGLAYISGALLFVVFAAGTAVALGGSLRGDGLRRHLPLLVLFATALLATLVQVWLVTQAQGSLLERNHATETVLPDDWRFWAFQIGLVARAFGLRATQPVAEIGVYVLVLLAGLALLVRAWRSQGSERRLAALAVGMVAAALVYSCVVATARSGFAGPEVPWDQVVAMAKARFHFWWLAALLPVPLAMAFGMLPGYRRWSPVVVPLLAAVLVVSKVLVMAGTDRDTYLRAGQQEAQGIACVRADHDRPGPLQCDGFYPIDIRAAMEAARRQDLRLWHELMQVP